MASKHYKSLAFFAVFFLCIFLNFMSCAKKEEPVTDDQRVHELLNAGQFSEASLLLERLVRGHPHHQPYKIRLASAYAGEIGFNLISAYRAFEPMLEFQPTRNAINSQAQDTSPKNTNPGKINFVSESSEQDPVRRFEHNLLLTIKDSELVTRVLFNLPYLNSDGIARVTRAIGILRQVPQESEQYQVAQIYEGVLQFLALSKYFRDSVSGVIHAENQTTLTLTVYCGIDLKKFFENLPSLLQHLRGGLLALKNAGANQQGRFFQNVATTLITVEDAHQLYQQRQDVFVLASAGAQRIKERVCDAF